MSGTFQPLTAGSQTIASGNFGVVPVSYGYYPPEGSRLVTAQYNWQAQATYVEDLGQLVVHGMETSIQSVFIDNSQNVNSVSLTVQTTGQFIICPPTSQGIFPLFFSGGAGFTIQSTILGVGVALQPLQVTRLYLLNVPTQSSAVWAAPPVTTADELPQARSIRSLKNISGTTTLTSGGVVGRVATIVVTQTTAVGTITFSEGGETAANTFFIIPIGALQGTIYQLDWPFYNGVTITFDGGATGTIAVAYSP
jgi:hypothetical protein